MVEIGVRGAPIQRVGVQLGKEIIIPRQRRNKPNEASVYSRDKVDRFQEGQEELLLCQETDDEPEEYAWRIYQERTNGRAITCMTISTHGGREAQPVNAAPCARDNAQTHESPHSPLASPSQKLPPGSQQQQSKHHSSSSRPRGRNGTHTHTHSNVGKEHSKKRGK